MTTASILLTAIVATNSLSQSVAILDSHKANYHKTAAPIEFNKDQYLAESKYYKQTVATGIGIDPTSSTRNAIENALKEIAQKAISKKTGARGLRSILENILLKTMYDLPSQDNIEEVIVDSGAAKGQSQPILVHAKGDNKSKSNKTTAA